MARRTLIFFVYLILGLLLINFSLNIFDFSFIESIEKWVVLVGGILVVLAGTKYLRRGY